MLSGLSNPSWTSGDRQCLLLKISNHCLQDLQKSSNSNINLELKIQICNFTARTVRGAVIFQRCLEPRPSVFKKRDSSSPRSSDSCKMLMLKLQQPTHGNFYFVQKSNENRRVACQKTGNLCHVLQHTVSRFVVFMFFGWKSYCLLL